MSDHPPILPPILPARPPRVHGPGRPARRHDTASRAATVVAAAAVLLVALVAAGCAGPAPVGPSSGRPGIAGLLVAASGALRITDEGGDLIAFDGPSAPIVAVTSAAGVVVTTADGGSAAVSLPGQSPREWRPLELPDDPSGEVRLMALSPDGGSIAVAVGDPQGPSFALEIVDPRSGAARSIAVPRGLNGTPSWLGPGTVAVDVIEPDGASAIATVEIAGGGLTDRRGTGTLVVAAADGSQVAVDDSATGDVLVGDRAAWESGGDDGMTRLSGPGAVGVEELAMSPDGLRLAIVRRGDGDVSVQLLVRDGTVWSSSRTLSLSTEDPVSVAWLT